MGGMPVDEVEASNVWCYAVTWLATTVPYGTWRVHLLFSAQQCAGAADQTRPGMVQVMGTYGVKSIGNKIR